MADTLAPPTIQPPLLRAPSSYDPNAKHRNIVIFLDGTGNQFSVKNSNVIKLLSVCRADESQMVYYSSGLGTVLPEFAGAWGRLKQSAAELMDMGLAWNFDDFVCDAYRYLMDNYQSGDQVYIFGFSRGAYTARALSGMIQKVGLLPPGNYNQVKAAYQVYTAHETKTGADGKPLDMSARFRWTFGISRTVSIQFVGVWDTVSSLGGIDLPRLPFAQGVRSVRFFRQAFALDERRARFVPEYRRPDPSEKPGDRPGVGVLTHGSVGGDGQTVQVLQSKECWFMGCHSDCGGGNDMNDADSLCNIPFRWMLREAEQCGLMLDPQGIAIQPAIANSPAVVTSGLIPDKLRTILKQQLEGKAIEQDWARDVAALIKQYNLGPDTLHQIVQIAAAYDTEMDAAGGGMPISNDLTRQITESLTAKWFPVEVMVLQTRSYNGPKYEEDPDTWRMNLGAGRQIVPSQYIHRSVQKRLQYDAAQSTKDLKFKKYEGPKARLPKEWGVDWAKLAIDKTLKVWED